MQDRMQSETLCTARRKSGQPCRNYALKGGNVCRMHGGAAPQVRRAAAVRILMASDLAAARLVAIMQDKTMPAVVQLAAARDLLDRAGLTSKQEIAVDFQMSKWEEAASRVVRVVEEYVQVDDDDDEPVSTTGLPAITAEPEWQEDYFPDRPLRDASRERPARTVEEPTGLVPKTREQLAARKAIQKAEEHERFNERYEEMLRRRENPPKPRRLAPRRQA